MRTFVSLHAAKTQFSQLVERAEAGEEIVIARGTKPVARLVRLRGGVARREPGLLAGRVRMAPDFDAPLSVRELAAFEDAPIAPVVARRRTKR